MGCACALLDVADVGELQHMTIIVCAWARDAGVSEMQGHPGGQLAHPGSSRTAFRFCCERFIQQANEASRGEKKPSVDRPCSDERRDEAEDGAGYSLNTSATACDSGILWGSPPRDTLVILNSRKCRVD